MAFTNTFLLFVACSAVKTFTGADNAIAENDHNVVIGPVENITAYFNGATNIVVTWDPAPVYLVHDVINASLDQITYDELAVSKHLTAAINELASFNSSNVTTSEAPDMPNQNNLTENDILTTATPASSNTVCRPISFFNNYSVAMKEDTDPEMVVAFKDSIAAYQLQKVKINKNQKVVPFSKGCITSYVVSWAEADNFSTVYNLSVLPTSSTANITSLKPGTRYSVVITAVFVSGDRFDNEEAIYFTTKRADEPEGCECDMHGAIAPGLGCNTSGSAYCNCKPGYKGIFCEMCAPGYYSIAPHFPCLRCPCDIRSKRKSPCQFIEGFLKCDSCEVGYTGNICHVCEKGFYKHSHHCVPCFCNGNAAAGNLCMPLTGACIGCQYNTTGFHCQECRPGYIGDPFTYKNCTLIEEVRARNLSSSSVSPGVVAAVIVTFLLIMLLVGAIVIFRRYHSKEKLRAFWTIEMKRDRDDVDFSSVHNDDARLDDADDVDFFSKHGLSSSSSKYSRLQEDI